jgi:hypothetical protein
MNTKTSYLMLLLGVIICVPIIGSAKQDSSKASAKSDSGGLYSIGVCPDTAAFSVYLSPSKMYKKAAEQLELKKMEVDTTPLFTIKDIRAYHKESHAIELDKDKWEKLAATWSTLSNRVFLVSLRHKIIYSGIVGITDTANYRQDYVGPYLYLPADQIDSVGQKYVVISYKDPYHEHDAAFDDERFNSEVYKVLSKNKKLQLK